MIFALQDQEEPDFHLTKKKAYGPKILNFKTMWVVF